MSEIDENFDWSGFLGRPLMAVPEPEALASLIGQRILITGAGGSIASALLRRLLQLGCRRLILLESSESHLYALEPLLALYPGAATPILGSVAEGSLLETLFRRYRPALVFHTAACKQVPLLESQPFAAIANNIFATESLLAAARRHHVRLLLLSTDKAVAPGSIMGATKAVAEQLALAHGQSALRLANVLGSRDSVVHRFAQQIRHGQPMSLTSATASRYFITLDEAVSLLLAASLAPDRPALFIPALEQPHRIADLAEFLAARLAPAQKIAVQLTAPRPGDKESEALHAPAESASGTEHPSLLRLNTAAKPVDSIALASLREALAGHRLAAALRALGQLVPDYTPTPQLLRLAAESQAEGF